MIHIILYHYLEYLMYHYLINMIICEYYIDLNNIVYVLLMLLGHCVIFEFDFGLNKWIFFINCIIRWCLCYCYIIWLCWNCHCINIVRWLCQCIWYCVGVIFFVLFLVFAIGLNSSQLQLLCLHKLQLALFWLHCCSVYGGRLRVLFRLWCGRAFIINKTKNIIIIIIIIIITHIIWFF